MQNKETDLNQKNNEAALASQEQVLPLVGELKGAELDFVAGGVDTMGRGLWDPTPYPKEWSCTALTISFAATGPATGPWKKPKGSRLDPSRNGMPHRERLTDSEFAERRR